MISINATGAASATSYYLDQNNRNLQKSLIKLSTGYRINSSVDDPGGLAVSMKLSAAIRRTDAVLANVANAISFLQSQDGVLSSASDILVDMSEVAVNASDETLTSSDLNQYSVDFIELQSAFADLLTEEFNDKALFVAGGSTLSVVTSEDGSQNVDVTQSDLATINTTIAALAIDTNVPANNTTTVGAAVDTAIEDLAGLVAKNGGEQSQLTFVQNILAVNSTNLEAAYSRIMDVDIARESTNYARYSIIQESGLAMLAQANASSESLLRLLE